MSLKDIFFTIYLGLAIFLFASFGASVFVWLSFFLNAIILTLIVSYHLYYEKDYSPFISSFIVFNFLFFLVAPIVQINSFTETQFRFTNFFPYKENLVIYTNFLITFFYIIFIISYILLKKVHKKNLLKKPNIRSKKIRPLTILLLFILSFIVFVVSEKFILDEYNRPSWVTSSYSISELLIWKKVMFLIPLAGVILSYQYLKSRNKNYFNTSVIYVLMVLFVFLLFWFKNPLTEKRNALGPIYILLIFLFYPKILNNNIKMLSFLFFSMIILFPLSAIITHSDATLLEIYNNPYILIKQMKGGGITNAFITLNYDAFSNVMTTIDYVGKNGFSYGYQFLGGLFFFIPRSIWVNKPLSSGKLTGEYLISDYGFSFSNLSNPFISEGYLNFGILGVLLFAIILAFVIVKMLHWLKGEDYLKKMMGFYFAMHLIFFLRGDFTNGYSYYIGTLFGVLMIPKIIELLIKEAVIKKKDVKIVKK